MKLFNFFLACAMAISAVVGAYVVDDGSNDIDRVIKALEVHGVPKDVIGSVHNLIVKRTSGDETSACASGYLPGTTPATPPATPGVPPATTETTEVPVQSNSDTAPPSGATESTSAPPAPPATESTASTTSASAPPGETPAPPSDQSTPVGVPPSTQTSEPPAPPATSGTESSGHSGHTTAASSTSLQTTTGTGTSITTESTTSTEGSVSTTPTPPAVNAAGIHKIDAVMLGVVAIAALY